MCSRASCLSVEKSFTDLEEKRGENTRRIFSMAGRKEYPRKIMVMSLEATELYVLWHINAQVSPPKRIFKENKEKSYRNNFPGPQNCGCSVAHKKVGNTGWTSKFGILCTVHTVRNLHFLSKNPTLIYRENCRFFFFLGENFVKMLWFWTF